MGLFLRQLRLLLWKNWTLQARRPVASVIGFLLPIILMAAFVALRTLTNPTAMCFETCSDRDLTSSSRQIISRLQEARGSPIPLRTALYYYPDNRLTRRILSTAQCLAFSDASSSEERNYIPQIKPSASAAAVSAELIADRSDALAGIVFNGIAESQEMLPANISYSLHLLSSDSRLSDTSGVPEWRTATRKENFASPGVGTQPNHAGLTEPLQYLIDQAFTRLQTEHATAPLSGTEVPLCPASDCGSLGIHRDGLPDPTAGTTVQCTLEGGSHLPASDPGLACCTLDLTLDSDSCNCTRRVAPASSAASAGTYRRDIDPIFFNIVPGSIVICTCRKVQLNLFCTCTVNGRTNQSSLVTASCPHSSSDQTVSVFRPCCGRCNDSSIIRTRRYGANSQGIIPVVTRRMPTKEYTPDVFITLVSTLFPIALIITFISNVYILTQELILEKKARLRETLRMMGCRNWILWLSWFINYFLQYLVLSLIIACIFKFGGVVEDANIGVLFIFFFLYLMSILFTCFFWSTIFSNPTTGALIAAVVFLVGDIPAFIFSGATTTDAVLKTGFCAPFFGNTCATYGLVYILRFQAQNVAVGFDNLSNALDSVDTFNLATVYGMLFCHVAVLGLLTWYIEAVFPGEYGIPKPFYFFLQPSYWFESADVPEKVDEYELDLIKGNHGDGSAFEPEPTGVNFGIRIQGLQKIFKSAQGTKVAVDGLTLNLVEGQITSLLGHNGAGKTTTMSMLTGLYNPTGGNAYINGKSVLTQMDDIRTDLGLCPQHNVLWDKLTVKEHLELFGTLKGLQGGELDRAVAEMVDDLQLRDKITWRSGQLSGGMKRKLSVGIALVGGSSVVIFDEPTAGMDPYARRATWDLLIKHKKDRTILLTTHYMDEADLLGDRIAIMADGQCKCVGSSLFLKSRYGVGYHLTIAKAADCSESALVSFIQKFVPTGKLVSSVGAEIAFILPSEETKQFPDLFESMEGEKDQLGVENFGLSVTTMEEVFIRVGQLAEEEKVEPAKSVDGLLEPEDSNKLMPSSSAKVVLLSGLSLWLQRMHALLIKRGIITYRSLFVLFIQIVVPVVALAGGLALLLSTSSQGVEPTLELGVSYFKSGASPTVQLREADFTGNSRQRFNLSQSLRRFAISRSGVSTESVRDAVSRLSITTDCCSNRYLILTEACIRMLTMTPSMCDGVETFAFNRCPNCLPVVVTTAANMPASTTAIEKMSGTCGEGFDGGETCPALPTDLQSSHTGHLQQYLLESGSLSGVFQDGNPAVFSLHTLTVRNTSYSYDDLQQRDVPAPCLRFTNVRPVDDQTSPFKLTSSKTVCDGFIQQYDNQTAYARIWSWSQNYHSGPAALNIFSNTYLESVMRDYADELGGDWPAGTYHIRSFIVPVKSSNDQARASLGSSNNLSFTIIFALGFSFMMGSFAILPLEEKKNKAKHIQYVSGVGPISYWLSSFLGDVMTYMVTYILMIIVLAIYNNTYINAVLGELALVLFGGGVASITLTYLISLLFSTPVLAFSFLSCFMFISSLAGSVATFALTNLSMHSVSDILARVFCIFPPFSVASGVVDLYQNNRLVAVCGQTFNTTAAFNICLDRLNITTTPLGFDNKGVGYNVAVPYAVAIACFLLVVLSEHGLLSHLVGVFFKVKKLAQSIDNEDSDVRAERVKVFEMDTENESMALIARDLTKSFRGKLDRPSSDHICLSISKGECFGLLGVNGAGKTTTFSMLTGEVSPSEGDAYIMGYSIKTQLSQVQQRVGFCPQFDALLEKMTAYELLTLFARLRGIPSSDIPGVVKTLVKELDLKKWANRLCGTYSGGNKRKLSTAIALVGDPPLIFLDEPTAGMDPAARRFLWDFLTKVLHSGRSIVLTSHSMEECEALCTRLAIMVNGQFKCLGSLQHIKGKFGKGFNLTAKIQPPTSNLGHPDPDQEPNTTPLKDLISANFPKHEIEDEHFGQVSFRIASEDGVNWSTIFRLMETNRDHLSIIDYSLSQTSLEQVFLNFAKKQSSND